MSTAFSGLQWEECNAPSSREGIRKDSGHFPKYRLVEGERGGERRGHTLRTYAIIRAHTLLMDMDALTAHPFLPVHTHVDTHTQTHTHTHTHTQTHT
jgi:hypothetical protein